MEAYTNFATVYDMFMDNVPYEEWGDYVHSLLKEYNIKQLLLAGGVSANKGLRDRLSSECEKLGVELLKPEIKYCTDNASMIGAAAYESFIKNDFTDYKLEPNPSLDL